MLSPPYHQQLRGIQQGIAAETLTFTKRRTELFVFCNLRNNALARVRVLLAKLVSAHVDVLRVQVSLGSIFAFNSPKLVLWPPITPAFTSADRRCDTSPSTCDQNLVSPLASACVSTSGSSRRSRRVVMRSSNVWCVLVLEREYMSVYRKSSIRLTVPSFAASSRSKRGHFKKRNATYAKATSVHLSLS
jgi:hypothetical protein